MRKTAISVPQKLLTEIDRAAKRRGESRSRFIQRLLAEAVRATSDEDFTRRLNLFFADQANTRPSREGSSSLESASIGLGFRALVIPGAVSA